MRSDRHARPRTRPRWDGFAGSKIEKEEKAALHQQQLAAYKPAAPCRPRRGGFSTLDSQTERKETRRSLVLTSVLSEATSSQTGDVNLRRSSATDVPASFRRPSALSVPSVSPRATNDPLPAFPAEKLADFRRQLLWEAELQQSVEGRELTRSVMSSTLTLQANLRGSRVRRDYLQLMRRAGKHVIAAVRLVRTRAFGWRRLYEASVRPDQDGLALDEAERQTVQRQLPTQLSRGASGRLAGDLVAPRHCRHLPSATAYLRDGPRHGHRGHHRGHHEANDAPHDTDGDGDGDSSGASSEDESSLGLRPKLEQEAAVATPRCGRRLSRRAGGSSSHLGSGHLLRSASASTMHATSSSRRWDGHQTTGVGDGLDHARPSQPQQQLMPPRVVEVLGAHAERHRPLLASVAAYQPLSPLAPAAASTGVLTGPRLSAQASRRAGSAAVQARDARGANDDAPSTDESRAAASKAARRAERAALLFEYQTEHASSFASRHAQATSKAVAALGIAERFGTDSDPSRRDCYAQRLAEVSRGRYTGDLVPRAIGAPPRAPERLRVTQRTRDALVLEWDGVTRDDLFFQLEACRLDPAYGPTTWVGCVTTRATSHAFTWLAQSGWTYEDPSDGVIEVRGCLSDYRFRVRAINEFGRSATRLR